MDITANREVGKIVYTLIRERMLAAGLDIPQTPTGDLGQTLNVCIETTSNAIEKLQRGNPKNLERFDIDAPWVQAALNFDPHAMLMMQTVVAMSFFSLQPPDSEKGLQVIPFTNDYFARCNFRLMDDEEMERLRKRFSALQTMQQAPGTLGAAGDALKQSTMRPFRGLRTARRSAAATRHRTFIRAVNAHCVRVEELTTLADRKAEGSTLGELLEEELRASRSRAAKEQLEMFWMEFDLLFGCTRLITT